MRKIHVKIADGKKKTERYCLPCPNPLRLEGYAVVWLTYWLSRGSSSTQCSDAGVCLGAYQAFPDGDFSAQRQRESRGKGRGEQRSGGEFTKMKQTVRLGSKNVAFLISLWWEQTTFSLTNYIRPKKKISAG